MRLQALDLRAANITVVLYGQRGENGEIARTIAFRCTGEARKRWMVADRKSRSARKATTVKFIDDQDTHWVIIRRGSETVMLYPPCGGYFEIYPDGARVSCQAELIPASGQPAFFEHGAEGCTQVRFEESSLMSCSV